MKAVISAWYALSAKPGMMFWQLSKYYPLPQIWKLSSWLLKRKESFNLARDIVRLAKLHGRKLAGCFVVVEPARIRFSRPSNPG